MMSVSEYQSRCSDVDCCARKGREGCNGCVIVYCYDGGVDFVPCYTWIEE
jgi:hypothetical protein